MAAFLFWASIALVAYTYGGYLLVLVAMDALRTMRANARYLAGNGERRREEPLAILPKVSVLVAAYNEAAVIREKLENTLALDYPAERLEILVGSDGSTDGTDEIVQAFENRGVKLSAAPRGGKVSVLNRLAAEATGSLWLFTDANTMLEKDALRCLVERMRDPKIGAVCGRLRLVAPDGAMAEEGVYWRYENLLKLYESQGGALTGANGGLYLLRANLWRALPKDTIVDDFLATMRVVLAGEKLVFAPEAVATEETTDGAGEFRRRTRIAAGNFQSLRELWPLLLRPDFAGFAMWSHKFLRWTAPLLLLVALLSNVALLAQRGYVALFALQAAFYLVALTRPKLPGTLGKLARLAHYFVAMNAALAVGLFRYLTGRQAATWQRTQRTGVPKAA